MENLQEAESVINKETTKMKKEKVEKYVSDIENGDGRFSQLKLWKLKKLLCGLDKASQKFCFKVKDTMMMLV